RRGRARTRDRTARDRATPAREHPSHSTDPAAADMGRDGERDGPRGHHPLDHRRRARQRRQHPRARDVHRICPDVRLAALRAPHGDHASRTARLGGAFEGCVGDTGPSRSHRSGNQRSSRHRGSASLGEIGKRERGAERKAAPFPFPQAPALPQAQRFPVLGPVRRIAAVPLGRGPPVRFVRLSAAALGALLLHAAPSFSQSTAYDTSMFHALSWREIGPYRGGRSVAVAGSGARPYEFWMGTTGGGVFKTTDGGTDWQPATDKYFGGTIGAIGVSESNPDIVYVGAGEFDIRGNVSHGDGVWKTTDD